MMENAYFKSALTEELYQGYGGSGRTKPGVTDAVCEWIRAIYPLTKICGSHHGYFEPENEEIILKHIASSGAEVLLVAFGAPLQDMWIDKNLTKTGVKVAMGVGGLFDFYSGRIPRAPQWLREIGGEWLYRFYQETKRRWKRYFVGNFVFLYRVGKEKFRHKG
jgi:N-acetylglucosaminyldiphosphoundecaprenol N-acetyl-beta-D-mannosaminyltransferase